MSVEIITIKVINKYSTGWEDSIAMFKIKKTTKLIKLVRRYEQQQGVENCSLRFMFNGAIISETHTAQQLQIENDGQIECCLPTNSGIVSTELYDLCKSDDLSLDALQEKISLLGRHIIRKACDEECPFLFLFFHQACWNKRITLDIINYLLTMFPRAGNAFIRAEDYAYHGTKASALHYSCYNEYCPDSVIELLVKKHPELSKANGVFWINNNNRVEGLPLHCYLMRNSNIDIETVEILVEAFPTALTMATAYHSSTTLQLVLSHPNINEILDIIMYLLESEPSSIHKTDGLGRTPLHVVCGNEGVNLEVVQFIYNAWPEAISIGCSRGRFPIHELCLHEILDDNTHSLDILRFMLDIDPSLVREGDEEMFLPIHLAVDGMSFAFCKVLIDAYPESVRVRTSNDTGYLPITIACSRSRDDAVIRDDKVDTIQHLLELYPESINVRDSNGRLPIHHAARHSRASIIELLLNHDSDGASKKTTNEDDQQLPLHLACESLEKVQVLYDAYPQAIHVRDSQGKIPLDIAREENMEDIVNFLQTQLIYSRIAQDTTTMATLDERGYLPLHRALSLGDVSLGSIKLLVRGNTAALQVADQKGLLPLHIACRKATASIVKFLADSYDGLNACDSNKDYPLHYACRAANLGVIKYLLKRSTSGVSEANNDDKLPFHLLIESDNEQVSESSEFTEACFLLLRAHPETVMTQTTSRKRRRE